MKKRAQVLAKVGEKLQIMDEQSFETFDAVTEPEVLEAVQEGDTIIFVTHNNETKVIEKSR